MQRSATKVLARCWSSAASALQSESGAQCSSSCSGAAAAAYNGLLRASGHGGGVTGRMAHLACSPSESASLLLLQHRRGLATWHQQISGVHTQALHQAQQQQQIQHLQHQARGIATAQPLQQAQAQQQRQQQVDSLELTQERIDAITDKIPQRPVTVVEGASYSVIILAAFAVLAFVAYQFVMNFILEPTALQCFNHTLEFLKQDPRVTVRLGGADEIRAWGSNSTSRVARQQVPHQIYKDASGTEHVRIQFYMRGPSGTGLVNADMHRDAQGKWSYTYLLVDVYAGSSQTPSRLYIVRPP